LSTPSDTCTKCPSPHTRRSLARSNPLWVYPNSLRKQPEGIVRLTVWVEQCFLAKPSCESASYSMIGFSTRIVSELPAVGKRFQRHTFVAQRCCCSGVSSHLGSLCVRLSKSRVRFLGRRFVRRPPSESILFGDRAWRNRRGLRPGCKSMACLSWDTSSTCCRRNNARAICL
jgi:hypothetical protein